MNYIHTYNKDLRPQNQPKLANNKFTTMFTNPTAPEIAYLLGFLWADGYISAKQNRITIEITTEDFQHIEKIVCKTGNWNIYHRNRINRQPQIMATLTDNIYLKQFLVDNDYTSKTKAPNKILNLIHTNLHPYWFRGLSDGDGCFYHGPLNKPINKRSIKHYAIGSTHEQDWSYIEDLFTNLGITYAVKRAISKLGHKDSVIRITNKGDIIKFGSYIYHDRLDIGLPRKYNKYLDIYKS